MILLNNISLIIGLCVLGLCAIKLLFFLFSIPRLFFKAVDHLYPESGPVYTRYVWSSLPWMKTRVWQNVWGPLYIRIPVSRAKEWSKKTYDTKLEGGLTLRQELFVDRIIKNRAKEEGLSVEASLVKHKDDKLLYLQAAERLAKQRGCSVEEVLNNDLRIDGD